MEQALKTFGIWFEEAKTAWADLRSLEFFDPEHSNDEDRFIRIGHSTKNRLVLVVFCERDGAAIRIISARKALAKEIKEYEKKI